MSQLVTRLILAASLMMGMAAYAAPDVSPANMPAGSYVLEKTHASINARVQHQGYSFYQFRLKICCNYFLNHHQDLHSNQRFIIYKEIRHL